MNHINLNDDFRQKLLESAAWGKAGIDTAASPLNNSLNESSEEQVEQDEQLQEEAHICPLCTSQLDEAIEADRVLEHMEIIAGVLDRLDQINESEEIDLDALIAEVASEILMESEYESEDEEYISEEEDEEDGEEESEDEEYISEEEEEYEEDGEEELEESEDEDVFEEAKMPNKKMANKMMANKMMAKKMMAKKMGKKMPKGLA
jgi:hypothetical protein